MRLSRGGGSMAGAAQRGLLTTHAAVTGRKPETEAAAVLRREREARVGSAREAADVSGP